MDAAPPPESSTGPAKALQPPFDQRDPDFAAACEAFVKSSVRVDARARSVVAPEAVRPTAVASEVEADKHAASIPDPPETAGAPTSRLTLEAQIAELRDELTRSQARTEQGYGASAERDALLEQISGDRQVLEDSRRNESNARREVEELQRALSAMTADRDADAYDLAQTTQNEGKIHAELETLREELDRVTYRYDVTAADLEAASQHGTQTRAELGTALNAISDLATTVEQLRQIVAQSDREIDGLRQRLLESEEARVTDAIAILESFGQ